MLGFFLERLAAKRFVPFSVPDSGYHSFTTGNVPQQIMPHQQLPGQPQAIFDPAGKVITQQVRPSLLQSMDWDWVTGYYKSMATI